MPVARPRLVNAFLAIRKTRLLRSLVEVLGVCLAIAMLIAACGDTSSTPATDFDFDLEQETPTASTDTAETPQEVDAYLEIIRLDRDATWQEVFDTITESEQACIREELGGQSLESALATPAYGILDEPEPGPWQLPIISCLHADAARALFLPELVGALLQVFDEEMRADLSTEEIFCLRDLIDDIGVVAVLTAFSEDDTDIGATLGIGAMACAPNGILLEIADELGIEPRELSEDEKTCIQEWFEDLDIDGQRALVAEEDPASTLDVSFGFVACVSELLVVSFAQSIGVHLKALNEEQESCVKGWFEDLDEDDATLFLASDGDPEATAEIGFGMFICVPELIYTRFVEATGLELSELNEGEIACLGEWGKGLDEEDLGIIVRRDDPVAGLELISRLYACLADHFPSGFPEDTFEEVI